MEQRGAPDQVRGKIVTKIAVTISQSSDPAAVRSPRDRIVGLREQQLPAATG
jgi:hypothetical protein